MGNKLNLIDNELYKSADEVLYYLWDPIGVAGYPYARDEYEGYLPNVLDMLKNNDSKENIINYLLNLEKQAMGLSPNYKKAENVVEILFEYKEKIEENPP